MRALGNTVAGGVVGDTALGLPMEEREDRDVVRARREAKRGQLLARSPFAGLGAKKADAHESQRQATRDVDEQLEDAKFTSPDLEPAPTTAPEGFETFERPKRKGGRQPREIPADIVETIRRLYGEGWSQSRIADHLGGTEAGWTQRSVATAMQRYGIERRPRGRGTERVRRGASTPTSAVVEQVTNTHDTADDATPLVIDGHGRPVELARTLAVLETPAALAAVPSPTLLEHPDVRALLAALADALDTSAEVVFADVRNATDRLRARSVANRRTAAASRGRAL